MQKSEEEVKILTTVNHILQEERNDLQKKQTQAEELNHHNTTKMASCLNNSIPKKNKGIQVCDQTQQKVLKLEVKRDVSLIID